MAKKIYCFINSGSDDCLSPMALCEDGHYLAGHFSSTVEFAKHDMGMPSVYGPSDWKHDLYTKHCPEGFELEWVDERDVRTHEGVMAAYKLNQALKKNP